MIFVLALCSHNIHLSVGYSLYVRWNCMSFISLEDSIRSELPFIIKDLKKGSDTVCPSKRKEL